MFLKAQKSSMRMQIIGKIMKYEKNRQWNWLMGYVRLYLDITLIFILKGVEMYTISYKTKPPYSKWYFSIKEKP